LTAKTGVSVNASRRYDEALGSRVDVDNLIANTPTHILTNLLGVALDYDITSKLRLNCHAMVMFDEYGYEEDLRTQKVREDTEYNVSPALKYDVNKWLSFDLSYIYTKRDSNYEVYDYDDNTVFLRANLYR
ncbi:MAG: outer membrane beta-barrel protein, partial [Desulfosudaceae bacterium]